jgi:hypothetical protein
MDDIRTIIEQIAREELEITTLQARNSDDEDFHTLAVWEIETVMERAYQAGQQVGHPKPYVRSWFAVGETLPTGKTQTTATFDTLQEALHHADEFGRPCFIDRWQSTSPRPGEGDDDIDETFAPIHYPF